MTEEFPRYGALRQPEYFFLKTSEKCYRLRVPWLCVQTVLEIIESPQGERVFDITYGYMPGPAAHRLISVGATEFLLKWATEEGWIE